MAPSQLPRALLFFAVALCGSPAFAAVAAGCTQGVVAKPGDSCVSLSTQFGITVSQFIQLNPTMPGCSLVPGATYCVATGAGPSVSIPPIPTPAPPSTSTSQASAPTGSLESSPDGSDGICGGKYTCLGSVYGDCCSLAGYCGNSTDYCVEDNCNPLYGRCGGGEPADGEGGQTVTVTVAGPTATVTKTVTVTAGATATPRPSPILQGTARNCKKYYQLTARDSCRRIERSNGITEDQIYTWNPNLDCDNLAETAGYYICVGV